MQYMSKREDRVGFKKNQTVYNKIVRQAHKIFAVTDT